MIITIFVLFEFVLKHKTEFSKNKTENRIWDKIELNLEKKTDFIIKFDFI